MSSVFLISFRIILWAFAFVPLITTVVFFVYGLFVRSELGGWPVVYENDIPASLSLLDQVALSIGAIFVCSVPLVLLSPLLLNSKLLKSTYLKCIYLYIASIALMFLLLFVTPLGSFVMWFLD